MIKNIQAPREVCGAEFQAAEAGVWAPGHLGGTSHSLFCLRVRPAGEPSSHEGVKSQLPEGIGGEGKGEDKRILVSEGRGLVGWKASPFHGLAKYNC